MTSDSDCTRELRCDCGQVVESPTPEETLIEVAQGVYSPEPNRESSDLQAHAVPFGPEAPLIASGCRAIQTLSA